MKKDIHPKYEAAVFSCACGNVIQTRSTSGDVKFDICSSCHPFYTGKQKLIDSAGMVESTTGNTAARKTPGNSPSPAGQVLHAGVNG